MKLSKGLNTDSRTKNSFKNIGSGVASQIIQSLLGFVSRTLFVKYLAVEYLGINGLFSSILSVLALAELGVGSAFVYSLYKPLADKDESTVTSVISLYKKVYIIIGASIFVFGALLIPFLSQLIPEKPDAITEDITVIYLFFLFNAASTYFFSYKVSLLNADQRNYVTTTNYLIFYVLQNITQITVLVLYQNFLLYLGVQLVLQFLSNVSISVIVDKYYPFLKKYKHAKVSKAIRSEIISNAKATLIIKIGGIIVNNTDNLIINYFSGLALLGIATNYNLLIAILTALILQVFNNLTASIAQVNAKESKEKQLETFKVVNLANFWIYGLASLCIVILTNDFITIWIGNDFVLPISISLALASNFFMLGTQGTIWTFKTTYGFFNQGKYLVLATAGINLILSFALGDQFGLFGILIATALARLFTNFWYDPYIVFKLGLKIQPNLYFFRLIKFSTILILAGVLSYYTTLYITFQGILGLLCKLIICLVIPNVFIILFYRHYDEFKTLRNTAFNGINILLTKLKIK